MKRNNLIAIAVAGACAWPLFATAAGDTHASGMGHWEVVTPSSVDESAPWLTAERPHLGIGHSGATDAASGPVAVITPSSVDESAPWLTAEAHQLYQSHARVASGGMPNPQTPWSPNESGANTYAQDMHEHAEHVASVEHARIAAAESGTAILASGATESEIDRLLLGSSDTPGEPGDREQVAFMPGLVDSRLSGMSTELSVEGADVSPGSEGSSLSGQREFDRDGASASGSIDSETEGSAAM